MKNILRVAVAVSFLGIGAAIADETPMTTTDTEMETMNNNTMPETKAPEMKHQKKMAKKANKKTKRAMKKMKKKAATGMENKEMNAPESTEPEMNN